MLHKWKVLFINHLLIRYKCSQHWTYLTRVLRLILVDQVHQEEPGERSRSDQTRQEHISSTTPCLQHSQVVGQVVFLQGVGFKPMRRPVKVVIPNTADETFSLRGAKARGVRGESEFTCPVLTTQDVSLTSMSSFTCSCWSLSSPNASMIKPEADHNRHHHPTSAPQEVSLYRGAEGHPP